MVNNNIRIVDLFGGIGGFRKGAENFFSKKNIKVECLLYAEKDKFARKTYFANWPDNHRWIYDVTKINEKTFCKNDKIDLLFAGFPCQPFSLMGKGKGFQDERGELFFAIEKIINQNRPEFFLLENVARIETINKRKTFLKIKQILSEKLKYNLFIYKLNSYDYGVEQIRRRIYFLGIKKKITEKQKQKLVKNPVYKGTSPSLFLEETVEDKYYLSEIIKKTILSNGNGLWKAKYEINRIPARPLVRTMNKMHRASQDNYYSDDFIKKMHNKSYIPSESDKNRIRRITPVEAFRLQGFDDCFVENAKKADVSDTQLYMQAGNSVSVPVIESLLEHVFSIVYNK